MPEDSPAVAGAGAPCGACRTLRRRCVPGCVFAPYFTAEDFAAVHGVFGASNASKMLEAIEDPEQRRVAAATLVEEASARARDPTFGRVSYLRILQEVNDRAGDQVDEARAEIAREFGPLAAAQPVDVAAAPPEVLAEARAQVDAALKHAREQEARLLAVRDANEARWRELHPEGDTGTGTMGSHGGAGNGKGTDVKRRRETTASEQTMMVPRRPAKQRSSRPPGFPDQRSHQQMAAAPAEREKAMAMRQAAPAKQIAEASREAAMRSVQAPAGAPPQRLDSAGQHAGTRQPHHAGDAAAGRAPGQGSTSVLLEAMMQLAGAGDEQQQHHHHHHVAQHAQKEVDISQEMMRLQELLDMAEVARKQKMMMKNDVMTGTMQWDPATGVVAMEQDATTTTMMQQQIPANTWQHQYPATQYAQAMPPQQMEEASTAGLAQTTGTMSQQQFAWAQQYHDPAASPWDHQMAEAHSHQPAAASASQAAMASEQDMLLLLQQHQIAAADELPSASGASHQFDNLAAQYDGTELTLGYGHPDMHMHQPVVTAGRHDAAAVLAEQEMMQLAAGAQQHGHPDPETQAMLQQVAAILERADERAMIRKQQGVTATGMRHWEPDAAWLLEKLKQIEKESMPDFAKRMMEIMSRQAEARHDQAELGVGVTLGNGGHPDGSSSAQGTIMQAQDLFAMTEMERKQEMLMRQVAAAGRAREQELYRKREMLMRQIAAAGRSRDQELIAQQATAAAAQQQQQHPVAQQYSGTELDISLGQGHGHPSWHQATVHQMLQDQQLPTVQQMLQEQQLADAVRFGGHQPNTTSVQQQVAAYANGEHGGSAGAAMAFLSPGSAKDAPFLVGQHQQPQPHGHQMGSSLSPLPQSLGQLHAQVSHQQRTDGGGQGLNSDLSAYLHYESLSRHGLAGNGKLQQG